jgi:hypothetical protein
MEEIFRLTREIIRRYDEANAEIELIKGRINNLNHEAELTEELTNEQKIENYERLQQALRDRRKCKDVIDGVPRIFGDVDFVKSKSARQEDYLKNRTYYPREEE